MKQLLTALALCVTVFAAHATSNCETKAADKKLAGAAKTSYVKKCEADHAAAASCEAKAVDKNGKPLAGAAKTSFVKKCESDQHAAAAPAAAATPAKAASK
jgi:hypothetical protein